MKVIGLTGPSGAGKGTVCAILAGHGIPAIDTDAVYHDLLDQSKALTDELCASFGKEILNSDRKVDRKKLGAAVFGHPDTPALLHTLNTITHKYVMARTHELMRDLARDGARAVIIDAPQLFEAHIENECDWIVGVLADRSVRLARIMARDGITEENALKRINAQKSDDFFRASCHYILTNDGDLGALEAQILRFLENSGLGA